MTDFVFRGDALALDFVNTEVMLRGKQRDLLASAQDFDAWWRAAQAHHPEAVGTIEADEMLLAEAKALRAALRGLFTAASTRQRPAPEQVDTLNAVLRQGHYTLDVAADGALTGSYGTEGTEGALLPLALAAFQLLTAGDLTRLHQCKNERCILLFYDRSKNGTRRWCSWDCMNRARSLKHYRAAKEDRE
ncbi:MAG: ABATE domain-containing protein [Anaerolineae bacterium]